MEGISHNLDAWGFSRATATSYCRHTRNTRTEKRANAFPSCSRSQSLALRPGRPHTHSSLRKGGGPRPSLRRARDHVAHGVPIQTPATSPCLMSEMRNCCKCVLVRSCCDPFSMSIATTVKYLPRCLLTALEMPPFPEKSSRKTERLGQNLSQQNGP